MAKGGRRRPTKRKKTINKQNSDESKKMQLMKNRKRQARKSKSLTRQIRGMKWDPEEYDEELEDVQ